MGKRAEIRRKKREEEKGNATFNLTRKQLEDVSKQSSSRYFDEVYQRGFNAAIEEAQIKVTTVALLTLAETFGFGTNKASNGRLDRFIRCFSEQIKKIDEPATEFTLEYYKNKLMEKTKIKITETEPPSEE